VNSWLVVVGAIGVVSALAALLGLGMTLIQKGDWGSALACLAGMAVIIFLLLLGFEYADEFWKERS
jgi:hypothetical protein